MGSETAWMSVSAIKERRQCQAHDCTGHAIGVVGRTWLCSTHWNARVIGWARSVEEGSAPAVPQHAPARGEDGQSVTATEAACDAYWSRDEPA